MQAMNVVRCALAALATFLCLGAVGCLVTQDLDGLSSGDCGDGLKACERQGALSCVPDDDPVFGCEEPFCDCALRHAKARCGTGDLAGKCVVATCDEGWLFCGGDPTTGCQIDGETDVAHCGQCGNECQVFPNTAEAACSNGSCVVGPCIKGFGACDSKVTNGCETNLSTDAAHCGACGNVCDSGVCVDGQCT